MASEPEIATATESPHHAHPMQGKVYLMDNGLSALRSNDIGLLLKKLLEKCNNLYIFMKHMRRVLQ